MSTILSRLIKRVSLSGFTTQTQRSSLGFSSNPSPSRHFHHVKWFHGLTGIPNDGRVVRLKNSATGSELYLVGTIHISKESAETVRKVINSVRPDAVAVELCRRRTVGLINWKPDNDNWYTMYRKSMSAPGGLSMKIFMLIINLFYRRLRADGIFPGLEFKVAMEESVRVKARFFAIDQDISVVLGQLSKILSFDLLKRSLNNRAWDPSEKLEQCYTYMTDLILSNAWDRSDKLEQCYTYFTRSSVREICGVLRETTPEIIKVLVDDRDKLMFTRLRRMEGKVIVAVVGLGHMDGIEHLWKLAEDDDDNDK